MFKTPVQPPQQVPQQRVLLPVPPTENSLPLLACEHQQLLHCCSYLLQVHFGCGMVNQPSWLYAQPQQQLQSYRQFLRVWCGNQGHFVLLHTSENSPTRLVPNSVPNKLNFWSELIVGRIQ